MDENYILTGHFISTQRMIILQSIECV